jgi:NAD(P)-dependent dehydrogenase (short-subunit alcohol dehydrogenase family)
MTVELFSLRGKRALVTGGSRGIGLILAAGLRSAGVEVTIASRKRDAITAAAEQLDCRGLTADLSTADGCRELASQLSAPLHILINNAGATWGAPLDDFPDAAWERVLNTNVSGVFQLTQALLPQMRETASPSDPARIVNIGSVDGLRVPTTDNFSYTASKAAVHMLTRHLAARLASESITVNAIAPGLFLTKMTAYLLDDPDQRKLIEAAIPMRRIGTPDDLVGAVTFLCSRAGAYLTGTVIPIDGGITGCG